MSNAWISLAVFVVCYVLFVLLPHRRAWVACLGGGLVVLYPALERRVAVFEQIRGNVMGLILGTLILAEIFLMSRVPAVMAEWLVDRAKSTRMAMLVLCALSGAISMVVENVAVVLLIAPVALSLADKLKISPVPLLIGIAVSSNLQGTATMIGDPPSMILAGHLRMGFWDFFVYDGRAGIFFAVQIGATASLLMLSWLFRVHSGKHVVHVPQETARSWFPTILLGLLVVGLSLSTVIDSDFIWFAGTFTLLLGGVALFWLRFSARWGRMRELLRGLDWDTTLFLAGIFVLVGGLSDSGWMDHLSGFLVHMVGGDALSAFVGVVVFSVLFSGVVDNVPFLLVMIPVIQSVAHQIQVPIPLLMFGLLIGACLGGNLTPIGASTNVVTVGLLRRQGYVVSFREFMWISIPFTFVAVVSACAFVWWVWGVTAR